VGEKCLLNTLELLEFPWTLVFSPSGKLVSFSKNTRGLVRMGVVFHTLFPEETLLDRLKENDAPFESWFLPLEKSIQVFPHLMHEPSGDLVALILTLLPKSENGFATGAAAIVDERVLHMDRLAQVGKLAASLAHEIRNPLAGISANMQVLADQLKNDPESQPFIDIVMEEVQRVDRILKDLLGFARQGKPAFQVLFLKDILTQVQSLVSAQLRTEKIQLDVELTNPSPTLHADLSQMIQIFLNLILNASQAITNGGRIRIHAQIETEKLRVNVEDTGCGMDQDTVHKIFEPFFSTKAFGLGLGLSVAHKIMEEHGGQIQVQSKLGVGTKIVLLFPNMSNGKVDGNG